MVRKNFRRYTNADAGSQTDEERLRILNTWNVSNWALPGFLQQRRNHPYKYHSLRLLEYQTCSLAQIYLLKWEHVSKFTSINSVIHVKCLWTKFVSTQIFVLTVFGEFLHKMFTPLKTTAWLSSLWKLSLFKVIWVHFRKIKVTLCFGEMQKINLLKITQ